MMRHPIEHDWKLRLEGQSLGQYLHLRPQEQMHPAGGLRIRLAGPRRVGGKRDLLQLRMLHSKVAGALADRGSRRVAPNDQRAARTLRLPATAAAINFFSLACLRCATSIQYCSN